jgi:hypothetical protein
MTGGRCCCVSVTVGRRCVAMSGRVWSTGMPVGSRAMVLPRSRAVTATVKWGAGGSQLARTGTEPILKGAKVAGYWNLA